MGSSDPWEQMSPAPSVPSLAQLQRLPAARAEDFLQQVFLMSAFPVFRAFRSWLIALVLSAVPTESEPLEKS